MRLGACVACGLVGGLVGLCAAWLLTGGWVVQGQDAASLAEDKASQAAQAAKARALMYKVLSDTADLLGLQA